jgi:hypothetical protein
MDTAIKMARYYLDMPHEERMDVVIYRPQLKLSLVEDGCNIVDVGNGFRGLKNKDDEFIKTWKSSPEGEYPFFKTEIHCLKWLEDRSINNFFDVVECMCIKTEFLQSTSMRVVALENKKVQLGKDIEQYLQDDGLKDQQPTIELLLAAVEILSEA